MGAGGMKTTKIMVNSNGFGMENALNEVESLSQGMGFDERSARRARLLAEETLSMVRAIVEDFSADFWAEGSPDGCFEIHLLAEAAMNYDKKQELIGTSSMQRNEASVGIMGKIKDFIEDSLYNMQDGASISAGDSHLMSMGGVAIVPDAYMWTLEKYREDVEKNGDEDADMDAALDELEKSIVANIADNVQVSVVGNHIELVIHKKFNPAG